MVPPHRYNRSLNWAPTQMDYTPVIIRPIAEREVPLVGQLKAAHRLALASNTAVIHFKHSADNFGILQQFDHHFLCYERGLLKPDPAFFHHVLGTLDTPAADCIFIDDRAENVESARAIGITAIKFERVSQLQRDLSAVL